MTGERILSVLVDLWRPPSNPSRLGDENKVAQSRKGESGTNIPLHSSESIPSVPVADEIPPDASPFFAIFVPTRFLFHQERRPGGLYSQIQWLLLCSSRSRMLMLLLFPNLTEGSRMIRYNLVTTWYEEVKCCA